MERTYLIEKINNSAVKMTAESIAEMERIVLDYCFAKGFDTRKVYVYCSHILYGTTDEHNVEYTIRMSNSTHTITTKRI